MAFKVNSRTKAKVCSTEGCVRVVCAQGLCHSCYQLAWRRQRQTQLENESNDSVVKDSLPTERKGNEARQAELF